MAQYSEPGKTIQPHNHDLNSDDRQQPKRNLSFKLRVCRHPAYICDWLHQIHDIHDITHTNKFQVF